MGYEVDVKFHKDFVEVNGNKITVRIASKPEKGKANIELIRKLAKYFNVPPSQVKKPDIIKSRRKIAEVIR